MYLAGKTHNLYVGFNKQEAELTYNLHKAQAELAKFRNNGTPTFVVHEPKAKVTGGVTMWTVQSTDISAVWIK